MSKNEVNLAIELLRDHFGDVIATLASFVYCEGSISLQSLVSQSALPVATVRRSRRIE